MLQAILVMLLSIMILRQEREPRQQLFTYQWFIITVVMRSHQKELITLLRPLVLAMVQSPMSFVVVQQLLVHYGLVVVLLLLVNVSYKNMTT